MDTDNFSNKQQKLFELNVNGRTKTVRKSGSSLTYLSWAWAWSEFVKVFPDATYERLPYTDDPNLGYMVHTSVTANGVTREMWLPVMNSSNKAMKSTQYNYSTKSGEKTVEQATMFEVNKAYMRCLTKNLAMFGLGTYIYAGEDLPDIEPLYKVSSILKSIKGYDASELLKIVASAYPSLTAESEVNKEDGSEIKSYLVSNLPKKQPESNEGTTLESVLKGAVTANLYDSVDDALAIVQESRPEYTLDTILKSNQVDALKTFLRKNSTSEAKSAK